MFFTTTFVVSIVQSRHYLTQQLNIHAQDVANALGISFSEATEQKDRSKLLTMLQAIFNSGYYTQIKVYDEKGDILTGRSLPPETSDVPHWFQTLVNLQTTPQTAPIMSGWQQQGHVTVQANSAKAYTKLWQISKQIFFWYASITTLALILAALLLRRILKPLDAIRRQAETIADNDFVQCDTKPKVAELSTVVKSMDKMATNVQNIIEQQYRLVQQLYQQAYEDSVTRLGNRNYLERIFASLANQSHSESEISNGWFYVIELAHLTEYAQSAKHEQTEQLLASFADNLANFAKHNHIPYIGRLYGGTFVLITLNQYEQHTEAMARSAVTELQGHLIGEKVDNNLTVYLGVAYFQPPQSFAYVLSQAEKALSRAQNEDQNQYAILTQPLEQKDSDKNQKRWQQLVKSIIESGNIQPAKQAVWNKNRTEILHYETFLRGYDETAGYTYMAGEIIKAAEALQLTRELDKIMIERTVNELNDKEQAMAVNLSISSLGDPRFLQWLSTYIDSLDPDMAARIIVEISEPMLSDNKEQLNELSSILKPKNIRLGIDHVGINLASLHYLSVLPIDYLKIDSSLTQASDLENTEFLLNNLCNIAHVLDIQVIASCVESKEQIEHLQAFDIDGLQGIAVSPIE